MIFQFVNVSECFLQIICILYVGTLKGSPSQYKFHYSFHLFKLSLIDNRHINVPYQLSISNHKKLKVNLQVKIRPSKDL